jgi:hypothetical protein
MKAKRGQVDLIGQYGLQGRNDGSTLWRNWRNMWQRTAGKHGLGKYYAGICVCPEWRSYAAFRRWATEHGYSDALTLDRIDGGQGYSPQNCRYATRSEQARNTRRAIRYQYDGEDLPLAEIAERTGMDYNLLYMRLVRYGMDLATACQREVKNAKKTD